MSIVDAKQLKSMLDTNEKVVLLDVRGDDSYIDTANTNKIRYINHNCNYNCDVEENENNGLMLIAARDIKSGEELTIDYGYEDIYDDCGCSACITEEELSP